MLSTDLGTITSVTDNGDGTYTATITSPTTAGTATITGTVNGTPLTDTGTVQFTDITPPNAPANVYDGTTPGADESITSAVDTLSANWDAVADADKYQYSITSGGPIGDPAAVEILSWTDISNAAVTVTAPTLPTLAGGITYYFNIKAIDAAGNQSPVAASNGIIVAINPAPLTFTGNTLPGATQNTPYNTVLAATGGTGPYTYAATGLPTGLILDPNTGVISGTPSVSGPFNINVMVTDNLGVTDSGIATLMIGAAGSGLAIQTSALMGGTQGTVYQDQIVATGGTGPYTFTIPPTSNPLPPGLILDSNTGVISGTLALPGTYTFTVQVQDSTGATVTQSYTIVVGASGSALQFDTTSLGNGTVGSIYNDQLAVSGGTGPYTFSITSGPLPAGLTLNSDSGQISGIAAAAGNYPLTIQVQDSTGATQTANLAITIGEQILVNNVSIARVGTTSGDPVKISWTTQPAGKPVDIYTIAGPYPYDAAGNYTADVFTTDRSSTKLPYAWAKQFSNVATDPVTGGAQDDGDQIGKGTQKYFKVVPEGVDITTLSLDQFLSDIVGKFDFAYDTTDTPEQSRKFFFSIPLVPTDKDGNILTNINDVIGAQGTAYSDNIGIYDYQFAVIGSPALLDADGIWKDIDPNTGQFVTSTLDIKPGYAYGYGSTASGFITIVGKVPTAATNRPIVGNAIPETPIVNWIATQFPVNTKLLADLSLPNQGLNSLSPNEYWDQYSGALLELLDGYANALQLAMPASPTLWNIMDGLTGQPFDMTLTPGRGYYLTEPLKPGPIEWIEQRNY